MHPTFVYLLVFSYPSFCQYLLWGIGVHNHNNFINILVQVSRFNLIELYCLEIALIVVNVGGAYCIYRKQHLASICLVCCSGWGCVVWLIFITLRQVVLHSISFALGFVFINNICFLKKMLIDCSLSVTVRIGTRCQMWTCVWAK
jgi:hypothetical protein